jgi:hypothetical protein
MKRRQQRPPQSSRARKQLKSSRKMTEGAEVVETWGDGSIEKEESHS